MARALDEEVSRIVVQLEMLGGLITERNDLELAYHAARRTLLPAGYNLVIHDRSANQILNAAVDPGLPLGRSARPDHVEGVFRSGKPALSDLMVGTVRRKLVVSVSVPIERAGEPLMLNMTIGDNRLREIAGNALTKRDGSLRWGISDRSGILVARSHDHERYVGTPLPSEVRAASVGATGVHWTTSIDTTPILRGYAYTRANWLVAVAIPRSEALRPTWETWLVYAAIVVGVVCTAIALSQLVANRLTEEVAALRERASTVGQSRGSDATSRLSVLEFAQIEDDLDHTSHQLIEAEQRRHLLVRELEHRSKNLLAITLSLVRRVLRGTAELDRARGMISGRLQALSDGTKALAEGGWIGASLHGIVETALAPFQGQHSANGPAVSLAGNWAVNFSLILHELATNSAKYGALSTPTGRVNISWSDTSGRFTFHWTELGGPPVTAPAQHGFGNQLLRSICVDANDPPTLDYAPSGFRYELGGPSELITIPDHAK